jgi:dephospho-CoA kinase
MQVIGLTGGIGMGKSTAAKVFRQAGVQIFDADAAVHALQAPGGAALPAIGAAFPGTVRGGRLDRPALRAAVLNDAPALKRLEGIIHPLVRRAEQRFVQSGRRRRDRAVVLDIPLLLEGRHERSRRDRIDHVVVVSAPRAVQVQRVRRRGRMTDAQIAAVIARQMPDRQKRRLADLVVHTGLSRYHAWRSLRRFILLLQQPNAATVLKR